MSATAALTLGVGFPGLDTMVVALSRYRADIADWTPFWRDRFAPAFYREMLENFISEGGATGDRWAPLSPAYAKWKAERFGAYGILVRSGALKASLLAPNAPGAIFRATSTSLEIGTGIRYAIFQQLGTQRRGAASGRRRVAGYEYGSGHGLPSRPPLRVSGAFMAVMGKAMQQFVQAAWTDARRGISVVSVPTPVQAPAGGGLL